MSVPLGYVFGGEQIVSMTGGRKVVSVGGTRENITSVSTPISGVIIQALRSNTGHVTVGGADVESTAGSECGIEITPGQTMTLPVKDLNIVWIDADSSNEGIQYLLLKG